MKSLADLRTWAEQAPTGTTIPVESLVAVLRDVELTVPVAVEQGAPETWRERLWRVPAETRLGVADVAEALDRPRSWVYRHTSPKSGYEQLPHRRLDGELVFVAGEIRRWVDQHEQVVVKPIIDISPRAPRKRSA